MNRTASELRSPPRPLVPGDIPVDRIFVRSVTAHCLAAWRGQGVVAADIAAELWPRDLGTNALITRAATGPATIGTTGWADALAARATGAFIGSLQTSAAARLIAASLQINLPGYATVTLPRASSTGNPQWVSEANPLPVAQAIVAAPVLGPQACGYFLRLMSSGTAG